MTDSNVKFTVPAEAVACLREALGAWSLAPDNKARAALESLEAEVGRLSGAKTMSDEEPREFILAKKVRDYCVTLHPDSEVLRGVSPIDLIDVCNAARALPATQAAVARLESELAEKTARVAALESGESAFLADVRDELRLKPGDGLLTAVQALKHRAELAEKTAIIALERDQERSK